MDGLGPVDLWDQAVNSYVLNSVANPQNTLEQCVNSFGDEDLSLQDQFKVLSVLPNYHRWQAKKNSGVKKEDYFMSYGKSPRNRIMRLLYMATEDVDQIEHLSQARFDILKLVKKKQYQCLQPLVMTCSKKRKTPKKCKPKLTVAKILSSLNISEEQFVEMKSQSEYADISLYHQFKKNLFAHGSIHWRILSNDCHKVVINDCDSESGVFKV